MKFAIKTTILMALLGVSLSAQALKNDTDQPINIDSGSQSLDMNTNTVVFDDGVTITQGSIIVKANKVTIVRQEGKKEILDAVGSPVTFQQTLDDGKPVNGKGSSVTYDVKKQQLKATSGGKTRVKTVLIPNQLNQNKK